jgi:hypothetical protein
LFAVRALLKESSGKALLLGDAAHAMVPRRARRQDLLLRLAPP